MDFFTSQENAIKKSWQLLSLYLLCVVIIILGVYSAIFLFAQNSQSSNNSDLNFFNLELFSKTALATSTIIFISYLFKKLSLGGGGHEIAVSMGGRKVDITTIVFEERKLLNIVEEVSIASGIPVPDIYILDHELSINAFAAGDNVSNAVIGISRGAIDSLSREEMQGLVAHEFSHILNGDMALNKKLICFLFSVLVIWVLGRFLLRASFYGMGRRRDQKSGTGIILFGLIISAVGMLGYFASFLLMRAISRQREYLADASAVQFTRNPDSIGNVLKKIGGQMSTVNESSKSIDDTHQHMFFHIKPNFFSNLMSTHPSLEKRILAIEPNWDGKFIIKKLKSKKISKISNNDTVSRFSELTSNFSGNKKSYVNSYKDIKSEKSEEINHSHNKNFADRNILIGVGEAIRNKFSDQFISELHLKDNAKALIFALLLSQDKKFRDRELTYINQNLSEINLEKTLYYSSKIINLASSEKIALIDLAIPALRLQTISEFQKFEEVLQKIITSDGMVDLFEYTLQKIVRRHLNNYFYENTNNKVVFHEFHDLEHELNILLSTISGVGKENINEIKKSFLSGQHYLEKFGISIKLLTPQECSLKQIDKSLDKFSKSTAKIKKVLLKACYEIASSDNIMQDKENELIRAIADTIDWPIPPVIYQK